MTWQDIVAEKQRQQAAALAPYAETTVSAEEEALTNIDEASKLAAKIAAGEVTSEAVVKAYIHKAYKVHKETNCLTEILFDDAIQRAKDLDVQLSKSGKPVGPLHGVPVTLKDQFDVKGWDSTIGYVGRALSPAKEDGALVQMLRKLGAVVIAKTNLPQSIMWCETDNNLFGLTIHPKDKNYTPGGSTGGEAVLLAEHASILGWGTDIGGSIRIPSQMMGLYGLKPSSARLPYRGVPVSTDGQEHVPSSVGPLARSLDTIQLSMQSLIDLRPWDKDSRCAPLPWRKDMYDDVQKRPLVFGVLLNDGVVKPHPPVTRVLEEAVAKLQKAGHHVVEWDARLHPELVAVMDAFYSSDGGEDIRRDIAKSGEPMIPHVEKLVNSGPAISVYDYWQLNRRKMDLQNAYLDKWASIVCPETGSPVDAVLMPPMPHTAVPHKSCGWVGYTKIWNVLDYPALVMPAGNVAETDLKTAWADYKPGNAMDTANHKLWTDHGKRMAELALPVGIQVIGRKLEEEKVLGMAKVIDGVIH